MTGALDLPPGMTPDIERTVRIPVQGDPCQQYVTDLLPLGWKIDTDVGPDIMLTREDGTSTPWFKPRELGIKPVSRARGGLQGALEYISDMRRMTRALLAGEARG